MKRFFLVFSILMIVFLALMAGSLAAVHYWAIETYKPVPQFVLGWAITAIPYNGDQVVYPMGDLYFVRQTSAGQIDASDVVLTIKSDGRVQGIVSGLVTGKQGDAYLVEGVGGYSSLVQPGDVVGVYVNRIQGFIPLLEALSAPLPIAAFTLVLAASIVLWRALHGKRTHSGLSPRDGEISSNLY